MICSLGPEPPSRGRWRGSSGTGALYLNQTKPNQNNLSILWTYVVRVGGGDRPVWISMVQRGSREWLNHDAEMNCHDGLILAQDGLSVD